MPPRKNDHHDNKSVWERKLEFAILRRGARNLSRTLGRALFKYFRVTVEQEQNVPSSGPAIIIANHSSLAGADALVLSEIVRRRRHRQARIMAHRFYFDWLRPLREFSFNFGLREPHVSSAVETLAHDHVMIVFPEGEAGNFKSSFKRYQLQRFHTGFLRMAKKTGAPIIPCLILGAEESHINLGSIDLSRYARKLRVPLPLNLIPLPTKWNIRFLEPVKLGSGKFTKQAEEMRSVMQNALNQELGRRRERGFDSSQST
jgi:1-acyl-sn-glycerol-3-phosphate acyltransferase